jgi:hypothetical protein
MCLTIFNFLDELFGINKNKKSSANYSDDFDFETTCECCGELLEDCECDWQEISRNDISQNLPDDEPDFEDDESFDDFDSF